MDARLQKLRQFEKSPESVKGYDLLHITLVDLQKNTPRELPSRVIFTIFIDWLEAQRKHSNFPSKGWPPVVTGWTRYLHKKGLEECDIIRYLEEWKQANKPREFYNGRAVPSKGDIEAAISTGRAKEMGEAREQLEKDRMKESKQNRVQRRQAARSNSHREPGRSDDTSSRGRESDRERAREQDIPRSYGKPSSKCDSSTRYDPEKWDRLDRRADQRREPDRRYMTHSRDRTYDRSFEHGHRSVSPRERASSRHRTDPIQREKHKWFGSDSSRSDRYEVKMLAKQKMNDAFYSPPPPSYVCNRCGKKGHHLQACPTNMDPSYDRAPPPTYSCEVCKKQGDHWKSLCPKNNDPFSIIQKRKAMGIMTTSPKPQEASFAEWHDYDAKDMVRARLQRTGSQEGRLTQESDPLSPSPVRQVSTKKEEQLKKLQAIDEAKSRLFREEDFEFELDKLIRNEGFLSSADRDKARAAQASLRSKPRDISPSEHTIQARRKRARTDEGSNSAAIEDTDMAEAGDLTTASTQPYNNIKGGGAIIGSPDEMQLDNGVGFEEAIGKGVDRTAVNLGNQPSVKKSSDEDDKTARPKPAKVYSDFVQQLMQRHPEMSEIVNPIRRRPRAIDMWDVGTARSAQQESEEKSDDTLVSSDSSSTARNSQTPPSDMEFGKTFPQFDGACDDGDYKYDENMDWAAKPTTWGATVQERFPVLETKENSFAKSMNENGTTTLRPARRFGRVSINLPGPPILTQDGKQPKLEFKPYRKHTPHSSIDSRTGGALAKTLSSTVLSDLGATIESSEGALPIERHVSISALTLGEQEQHQKAFAEYNDDIDWGSGIRVDTTFTLMESRVESINLLQASALDSNRQI